MIQLALRSSTQADVPSGVDEVGQDRRQRDGRDHQLEPGQEHARPEHGEQHERRTAIHGGSVVAGRGIPGQGPGTSRIPKSVSRTSGSPSASRPNQDG